MRNTLCDTPTIIGPHVPVVLIVRTVRPLEGNWTVVCLEFGLRLVVDRVVKIRFGVVFVGRLYA